MNDLILLHNEIDFLKVLGNYEEYTKNFKELSQDMMAKIKCTQEFYEKLSTSFVDQEVKTYFENRYNDSSIFDFLCFYLNFDTVDDFLRFYNKLDKSKLDDLYAKIINTNFFDTVNELSIDDSDKMELLNIYNHLDVHLPKLINIISRVDLLFKENFQTFYKLINDFYRTINKYTSIEYMAKYLDIKVDTGYSIICLLFSSLTAKMYENDLLPKNLILVGYLYAFYSVDKIIKVDLSAKLKTLAEPKKLEILFYLSEKERSFQEITNYIMLSKATVSHHISGLLECEYIIVEKKNNNLFCKINKKKIEETILDLRRKLKITR